MLLLDKNPSSRIIFSLLELQGNKFLYSNHPNITGLTLPLGYYPEPTGKTPLFK